jgi:hypothetical protein
MMLIERWAIAVILAAGLAFTAGAPGQSQDAQPAQDDTQPVPAPPAPPAPPADPAQQQLEKDTAELLQLVQDLKAEVDKAGSDTLSLAALRKADAIQKLAKSLKDRMKDRVQATVSKP